MYGSDVKSSHWGNWRSFNSDGVGSMDKWKFHLGVLTVCQCWQLTKYFDGVSLNFALLLNLSETTMNSQAISRKVWFCQYGKEKPFCCEWHEDLPESYTLTFLRKSGSVSPLRCNYAKYQGEMQDGFKGTHDFRRVFYKGLCCTIRTWYQWFSKNTINISEVEFEFRCVCESESFVGLWLSF